MIPFKKMKKSFWKWFAPKWPPMRAFLLRTHIIWHEPGRQRFHIGWLRGGATPDEFRRYLESIGFHDHSLSWIDDEEVFGIRLEDKENDDFQYHIRLFKDGEIRGHYEYVAEAYWFKHFLEVGMEQRREQFLKFLGDWTVERSPR